MKPTTATPKDIENLYEAVLQLKDKKECKKFFRDLCTMAEINAMAERVKVVKMVSKGTPYREICDKTGVSTATITRIAHWLNHGMGGYKLILDRLK